MEIKNGILFEEFKTNVKDIKSIEYPEVNIKFKDIYEYENFLNIIKVKSSFIEDNHILLIKERLKIAKIRDKKKYIFDKLKNFLKELGYTKEVTLRSSPFEISKEIDKDGFGFWCVGKGIDTYFNVIDLDTFSRNLCSIEGMVESIMDELVDYNLFIEYKDFKWDTNNPLRFLLYMMSHMYKSNKHFVSQHSYNSLNENVLSIRSLGSPYDYINCPDLEIYFGMNKSNSINSPHYFELSTNYNGTEYHIKAVFDKNLFNESGIFNIQLREYPHGKIVDKSNTYTVEVNLNPSHKDFYLVKDILRLREKIELYVYDKHPEYEY